MTCPRTHRNSGTAGTWMQIWVPLERLYHRITFQAHTKCSLSSKKTCRGWSCKRKSLLHFLGWSQPLVQYEILLQRQNSLNRRYVCHRLSLGVRSTLIWYAPSGHDVSVFNLVQFFSHLLLITELLTPTGQLLLLPVRGYINVCFNLTWCVST